MQRFFWIIMAALGAGLILLVVNHDSGTTLGLQNEAFAETLYMGVWGIVLGAALLGSRIPFGDAARSLAIWLAIALVLMAGYQYRYELQDIASRVTAGLIPGSPMSISDGDGIAVMLDKRSSGHFEVRGEVDGRQIDFLIDTGATTTVLTAADASRVGIDVSSLSYSVPVSTANGVARAARASADEIRIGEISRSRIPLLIAEPGRLGQSLLGMNFLETLSGFDVRGDRLILRD
ncbi:MAG: TIGR02281 family clan AA aspartic protease [Rhizobiaceae bacterium]